MRVSGMMHMHKGGPGRRWMADIVFVCAHAKLF